MRIGANGLEFEIDDQGPRDGAPLLLIMGLGMQLIAWPEPLVAELVKRRFRVIRMDNRDIGLSQHLDTLGVPSVFGAMLRHTLRLKVTSPYSLQQMAADCAGVLDALGIVRAHVCGASMGGMIAQHLAARHASRVASLTLVMTTSGARHLPKPSLAVRSALLARPKDDSPEARCDALEHVLRVIGSPGYPPDPVALRARVAASVARSWHPQGTARQLLAIAADGDRTPMLSAIAAPTAIVHGMADPLIPVAAASDLARKIRGATLDLIPGMGHDLPTELLPRLAADIAGNVDRVH